MAVSLLLNTVFAGEGYFANCKAELYSREFGQFVRRQSINITSSGNTANVNFTQDVTGNVRVVVRDRTSNALVWRSVELEQRPDESPFRFSILLVDNDRTTFSSDKFEEEVDLPHVQDVDDLDEDVVVEDLDVLIHGDYIHVDGEGKVAKGEDWTILAAKFDFDYDFELKPSSLIDHRRLLRVLTKDFRVNFDNWIIGIGAACMQDRIANQVRNMVSSLINEAIRDELTNRVQGQFGDDNELTSLTSATVQSIRIIETETTTVETGLVGGGVIEVGVHEIVMRVDVSVPTELIQQASSNSGCLGLLLLGLGVSAAVAAAAPG